MLDDARMESYFGCSSRLGWFWMRVLQMRMAVAAMSDAGRLMFAMVVQAEDRRMMQRGTEVY